MQIYLLGLPKQKSFLELKRAFPKSTHYDVYTREDLFDEEQNLWEEFKNRQNLILTADIVIADESAVSIPISYELALALDYKKPCLLTISQNSKAVERLLGLKHKKLTIKRYSSSTQLSKIIADYIQSVKNTQDAKLFMNIPPNVNKYLEWIVANTNKSKSDVVRSAVENAARKDKKYQVSLKPM